MLKVKKSLRILSVLFIGLVTACGGAEDEKEATVLEWDFNQSKKYNYSYHHDISTNARFSKEEPINRIHSLADASLEVITDSTEWAQLTLFDMNLTIDGREINQTLPPAVMEKMKANGTFKNNNRDALFDLIFVLPKADLAEGSTDQVPIRFPFMTPDSVYFSNGTIDFTFEKIDTLENVPCALLNGEIVFNNPEFDPDLKGDFACNGTGSGTYYFDIEKRCYKKALVDVRMNALWAIEADSTESDMGPSYSEIDIHSVYEVNLQSVE